MSADSVQSTFDGAAEQYWAAQHLSLSKPADIPSRFEAHVDRREAWCDDCQCRVTVTANGKEVGHATECEHHCYGGDREGDEAQASE